MRIIIYGDDFRNARVVHPDGFKAGVTLAEFPRGNIVIWAVFIFFPRV